MKSLPALFFMPGMQIIGDFLLFFKFLVLPLRDKSRGSLVLKVSY